MEYKFFPHKEYRPFQEEGMEAIRVSAVRGIPLLFSSPTGTGKTAMVYGGVLEARMEEEKLAVITRTHSQYRIFVEEFNRLKKKHKDLSFGMLIGRKTVCPMKVGPEACAYMRKNSLREIKNGTNFRNLMNIESYRRRLETNKEPVCPYYINCMQVPQMRPLYSKESMELIKGQMDEPLKPEGFIERCLSEGHPKCPYELMKATLNGADIVVLHYQYILDPKIRDAVLHGNWLGSDFEGVHLVVDEAHNLAPYIQDICSSECTKDDVLDAIKLVRDRRLGDIRYDLSGLDEALTDLQLMISDLNVYLDQHFSNKSREELLSEGTEDVLLGNALFKTSPELLALLLNISEMIAGQFLKKKEEREIPEETPLPGLCRVAETLSKSNVSGDRYIKLLSIKPLLKYVSQDLEGAINISDYEITLKVADIDPRDSVKDLVEAFRSLTLISGTLSPTALYRRLLFHDGIEVKEKTVPFPFPKENRVLFACRDTSSQRRLRDDPKNIEAVKECIKALFTVEGNIALFFTGYEMKKRYLDYCLKLCRETGKKSMDESRDIDKNRLIEEYKRHGNAALFAVCRGSFSEGVDFIGEAMNAVAIIGLPLAPWNEKQKLINRYYEKAFGQGIGKTIAYDLPAVTAAAQAAGRCLRSEEDTGVIVFADSRYAVDTFMGVKRILPEWMQEELLIVNASEMLPVMKEKTASWGKKQKKGREMDAESLIMETVKETGERYGVLRIAETLKGSKTKDLLEDGLENVRHYGSMSHLTIKKIKEKIEHLVKERKLYSTGGLYPKIKIKK